MADHSGFLTAWVQHDKKLVCSIRRLVAEVRLGLIVQGLALAHTQITYRLMSRERRIHVNEAKE